MSETWNPPAPTARYSVEKGWLFWHAYIDGLGIVAFGPRPHFRSRTRSGALAKAEAWAANHERAEIEGTCGVCGGAIGWIDCPTGGWWAHYTHPSDDHDAEAPVPTRAC